MGHLVGQVCQVCQDRSLRRLCLSDEQRVVLEHLVRPHTTGQALVKRVRVVLLAALGYSNMDIARQVPMDEEAVGLWRRRWAGLCAIPLDQVSVADRLADAAYDESPGYVYATHADIPTHDAPSFNPALDARPYQAQGTSVEDLVNCNISP